MFRVGGWVGVGVGGVGLVETNFQLWMLNSNLLKSQIPMFRVGGEDQFPTLDAEFKFAKIQNSYVQGGGGGVSENQFPTFDAKSKFSKRPNSNV